MNKKNYDMTMVYQISHGVLSRAYQLSHEQLKRFVILASQEHTIFYEYEQCSFCDECGMGYRFTVTDFEIVFMHLYLFLELGKSDFHYNIYVLGIFILQDIVV